MCQLARLFDVVSVDVLVEARVEVPPDQLLNPDMAHAGGLRDLSQRGPVNTGLKDQFGSLCVELAQFLWRWPGAV